MDVIVYEQGGGLPAAIVRPAPGVDVEDATIAVPEGVTAIVIDDSDIPADRTFRDAWQIDGRAIAVDMVRARDIHREHLRAMRAPLLAETDAEFLKALESDDKPQQALVAAKKQALRDVTIYLPIAAARTPEELKAAIPGALQQV